MAVSRHMFFNDALWLTGGGQRMVHPDIPSEVAEPLGCQSLRYHHQVGCCCLRSPKARPHLLTSSIL